MTPDKYTIAEKMINVGDGHKLYAQLWGNKKAKTTIVFLHGGPGSGCNDGHKEYFDHKKHRVIFFDQRGCGKSRPYGLLKNNNTKSMIGDIDKIAAEFEASSFAITGGSWGSCLALAYAINNPHRITHMVLRGLFTGRKSEIDFLNKGRAQEFYPDAWEEFVNSVPGSERNNSDAYLVDMMLGKDKQDAKKSAYIYAKYTNFLSMLNSPVMDESLEDFDPIPTIIECYYLQNDCFLPKDFIISNVSKLKMPIDLVHGRYDAICPPATAYELHKKLPNSTLTWTIAGHSGGDPGNQQAVRELLLKI